MLFRTASLALFASLALAQSYETKDGKYRCHAYPDGEKKVQHFACTENKMPHRTYLDYGNDGALDSYSEGDATNGIIYIDHMRKGNSERYAVAVKGNDVVPMIMVGSGHDAANTLRKEFDAIKSSLIGFDKSKALI